MDSTSVEPHIKQVFKPFYEKFPEEQVEHAHNIAWHLAQSARATYTEIRMAVRELEPVVRATDKLSLYERLKGLEAAADKLAQALKLADGSRL